MHVPHPNRTHSGRTLARRIVTAVAGTITAMAAFGAVAGAADYDNAAGFLKTPSGATATAAMQCGRFGVLATARGYTAPQYFAYNATNSSGQSTGWSAWQPLVGGTQTIITRPGYWLVQVQILHWGAGGWTTDMEFAPVTVQPDAYRHQFWCKTLG